MMKYDKSLNCNARSLRRGMTPEEKHLWYDFLKKLPVDVKRQKVIGSYIVDFYIASCKLVIEVDGRGHLTREQMEKDSQRDAALAERGIRVLRCRNEDVRARFKQTCDRILDAIDFKFSDMLL